MVLKNDFKKTKRTFWLKHTDKALRAYQTVIRSNIIFCTRLGYQWSYQVHTKISTLLISGSIPEILVITPQAFKLPTWWLCSSILASTNYQTLPLRNDSSTMWSLVIEEETRIEQKRSYFFLNFSIWHL